MTYLSAADLASIGNTPIMICSAAFPNVYLRLDGTGMTSFNGNGGGTVNCQYNVDAYAKFKAHPQADGSICLESVAFPNVYLRFDGSGVTAPTDYGGGWVNCQYTAGDFEKLKPHTQSDGSVSFEGATFANVYLRMDGSGVTAPTAGGAGSVNGQYQAGPYEKFFITMDTQRLVFNMQHQQQGNWCWSALTTSVAAYYDPTTAWTQCSLVNAEFGRGDCCNAGSSASCNQPWFPDRSLTRVGRLNQFLNGTLTTVQVAAEMAQTTPVGVGTYWAGGGGHAIAIRGRFLSGGTEYLSIADPWFGDSDVTYDSFLHQYQGTGSWGTTYKTKH
jgi:Papain-like cysteine protease AvrRpt2